MDEDREALHRALVADAKATVAGDRFTNLERAILTAAGMPTEYPDDLSELQAQLSGEKEQRLEQAVQKLFTRTGTTTEDPQELAKAIAIATTSGPSSPAITFAGPVTAPVTIKTIYGRATETAHEQAAPERPAPSPETLWLAHSIRPGSQTIAEHFVGRTDELRQLGEAVAAGEGVICIIGMAGQGKSALLGEWYKRSFKELEKRAVFWCRPYETGYTFARFLADVLPYVTGGEYDPRRYLTTDAQVDLLCAAVRSRPTRIVLDGAERWLKRWVDNPDAGGEGASVDDRAAADPALDTLLADAAVWPNASRIVLTTRGLPSALDHSPKVAIGTADTDTPDRELRGLEDGSAADLLEALRVRGKRGDRIAAANAYGNHAKCLEVLGALLADLYGGDVARRNEIDPFSDGDPEKGIGHLLDKVAARCGEDLPVLTLAACCLVPAPVEMLSAIVKRRDKAVRQALTRLDKWNVLDFKGADGLAGLHALVRKYFLGRADPAELRRMRTEIAGWFGSRPLPKQPQMLEDVSPLILATQHALEAGDADLATDFLYGTPAGKHYPTLSGWLDAFGHLKLDEELLTGAIRIYERLIRREGRKELRNDLAMAYNNRGLALRGQGNLTAAVADFARAVEIYETLVSKQKRKDLRNELAVTYNSRGAAFADQGDPSAALADFGRAVEIYETLVSNGDRRDLRKDLAGTYNNRGNALAALGDLSAAVADYDSAIEIRETLVQKEKRKKLRNDLATAYNNRGNALQVQGDLPAALADYNRAVEINETLVYSENRKDLRNDLAKGYNDRGLALADQGDLSAGMADCQRALQIYEALVHEENHKELRNDLASAYNNRGVLFRTQGDLPAAVADFGRAIDIREGLVHEEGRAELAPDLAKSLLNRALAYRQDGKLGEARGDMVGGWNLVNDAIESGQTHLVPTFLQMAGDVSSLLLDIDEAGEAAKRINAALGFCRGEIAAGRVTEVLKKQAAGMYAHLGPDVEKLAEAGLDAGAFAEVGAKLGVVPEDGE